MSESVKNPFGLYLVLTDPIAGYPAVMEAAVACEVQFVQLRMKNATPAQILETARILRRISAGSPTRFIVNDSVQIAAEADADGVHLGQDDDAITDARTFWQTPGKLYGLSTHNEAQAAAAVAFSPDYIGVGPVFATPTKAIADPVVGLELLRTITSTTPLVPVPIGGIDRDNLPDVLRAGGGNYAVVRAVTQSSDPASAIRLLQRIAAETLNG